MKIVADENVEMPVIHYLRQQGHQVIAVMEEHGGISDEQVLSLAIAEQSVLLTSDHDFGQLIFAFHHSAPFGIMMMRLPDTLSAIEKARIVASVYTQYEQSLANTFTVISESNVRITRMP